MDFKVGEKVTINKCDVCPSIVGKTARVSGFGDDYTVLLSFGRGRPRTNRPKAISVYDVSLVKE